MSNEELTFYSSSYCPFVQRSWLVLLEKNIEHKYVEIALRDENKELYGERKRQVYPWLYEMNPSGTVPIIKHGDKVLYESLVICDYLDEAYPSEVKLMPTDPYQRALVKLLISHIGNIVPMLYQAMGKAGEKDQQDANEALIKKLDFLNSEMIRIGQDGPYMIGKQMTMADIAFVPFLARMVIVLGHFRKFEIPARLTRLIKWYETMKERESYKKTLLEDFEGRMIDVYGTHYVKK